MNQTIQTTDKLIEHYKVSWLKNGNGIRAVPVLGLESYKTAAGQAYGIIHHGTMALLADGYMYQSMARGVAQEVIAKLQAHLITNSMLTLRNLFSQELQDYLMFYRYLDLKKPLTLEEFCCGIDYERILADRRNSDLLIQQEQEYKEELWSGDISVGWVATPEGDMPGNHLSDLIEGRPLSGDFVFSRIGTVWDE